MGSMINRPAVSQIDSVIFYIPTEEMIFLDRFQLVLQLDNVLSNQQ